MNVWHARGLLLGLLAGMPFQPCGAASMDQGLANNLNKFWVASLTGKHIAGLCAVPTLPHITHSLSVSLLRLPASSRKGLHAEHVLQWALR